MLREGVRLRAYAGRDSAGFLEFVTRSHRRTARVLLNLARLLTRFRIEIDPWMGPPLPNPLLVVSNHQSLFDIPSLTLAFPRHALRFVAKKELRKGIPYVSFALRHGGHALVSRTSDFREGARELARFARLARRGISPAVFPEGTRSRDRRLGRFNAGAFRLILEHASLPVLSVAIDGAWRMATLTGIVANLGRVRYRIKPLALHPAPRGKREILDLLGKVEREIGCQLAAWQESSPPGWN